MSAFGAHYIRELSQGRPRERKSGRKNERTILNERCHGLSRPCGLLSKIYSAFWRNSRTSSLVTEEVKKNEWSGECKNAVNKLKKKLLQAPVLGYPNDRYPYTLTTGASLTGFGPILNQKSGTEDRVIEYASKTLSKK